MNPGGNLRLTAAVGLLVLAPVAVEVATVLLGVVTRAGATPLGESSA
jgi:hypothetical protein